VDYLVAENKKSEGIIKPLRGRLPVAPMVLIGSRFAFRPEIHNPSVNGGIWNGRHRDTCMRALGALGPMGPDGGQWQSGSLGISEMNIGGHECQTDH
jgi:hypothetical protein